MRLRCIFALFSLVCGCGEQAATPAREPPSTAPPVPAETAAPSQAAAAAPGQGTAEKQDASSATGSGGGVPPGATTGAPEHLQGASHLTHVFEALAALEDGHAHDDVRILQYGDSHTAADVNVGTFRHLLQARFGDGGRGFLSLGRPWKTYSEDGVHTGMDPEFSPTRAGTHNGFTLPPALDGRYGLLGVGIAIGRLRARAWSDVAANASHVEIAYAEEPTGGSFDVFVDGTRTGRVSTRGPDTKSAWTAFEVPDAPHRIEVRTAGDGDVVLYGMLLDRAEAGVVVDTLGINGAQVFTPLHWNEDHFAEQLKHAAPDLVVLAYGTNEALNQALSDATYQRALVDLLGRIARAAPAASCLLLGPTDLARRPKGQSDWRTWPRLDEIIAVQKRVADAAGCAFFDQREAMGGPGSMIQWASEPEPRANVDRVHLRRSGYVQVGTAFATDLMRAYDEWRAERGLPPAHASHTWGVAAR